MFILSTNYMATYSRWQYSSQFQTYAVGYNVYHDVVIWRPFSLAPNPFTIILEEIRRMWTLYELHLHPSASESVTSYHDENHMWTQGCHSRHIYWYRKRISHSSRDSSVVMRSELCAPWRRNIGSNPQTVQISSGAHWCFYSMGTVVTLAGTKRPRNENYHLSLHPLPSSRLHGAIPPLYYRLRWHEQEEF